MGRSLQGSRRCSLHQEMQNSARRTAVLGIYDLPAMESDHWIHCSMLLRYTVELCQFKAKIHYSSFSVTSWPGQKSVVSVVSCRFPNSVTTTCCGLVGRVVSPPRLFCGLTPEIKTDWLIDKSATSLQQVYGEVPGKRLNGFGAYRRCLFHLFTMEFIKELLYSCLLDGTRVNWPPTCRLICLITGMHRRLIVLTHALRLTSLWPSPGSDVPLELKRLMF